MKAFLNLSILLAALISTSASANDQATLKDTFEKSFHIGAALKKPLFEEDPPSTLNLVQAQFDSISSCNMLKWGPFNPKPDVYRHDLADAYVEFGIENNMYIVGHVLFWHNQTPKWVYKDEKGQALERKALLTRMRDRVKHVAQRYGNKINAWDVVNESIMGNGKLRDSEWTRIIGEDFIEQAFRIADEELPGDVELLYNDYSMNQKGKRNTVVSMIKTLKEKSIRIDGVGLQGHWALQHPPLKEIEASIVAFAEAGVDVHITELDIDVLPRKPGMFGADVSKKFEQDPTMNPYVDELPPKMQAKLAQRYADLFQLFLKHKDKIKRVTFWGTTDKYSWLNDWPIRGRTSYPLLFDRDGQTKPAFDAVVNLK